MVAFVGTCFAFLLSKESQLRNTKNDALLPGMGFESHPSVSSGTIFTYEINAYVIRFTLFASKQGNQYPAFIKNGIWIVGFPIVVKYSGDGQNDEYRFFPNW